MTVTVALVATTGPAADPVLMFMVNVSDPSVVRSAVGVRVNEPALLLMLKDPPNALKSELEVVPLTMVQYSVVPLGTNVVLTLNVPVLPSLILVGWPLKK